MIHFRQDRQQCCLACTRCTNEKRRTLVIVRVFKILARLSLHLVGKRPQASSTEKERHQIDKCHVSRPVFVLRIKRSRGSQEAIEKFNSRKSLDHFVRHLVHSLAILTLYHSIIVCLVAHPEIRANANVLRRQELVETRRRYLNKWHLQPRGVEISIVECFRRNIARTLWA